MDALLKDRHPWKARGNYPSSLSHPCLRKLWNDRDHGDRALPLDPGVIQVMEEGKQHEALTLKQLQEAGVIIQQQQSPVEDKDLAIYGKIDGRIADNGRLVPLEIKSLSPYAFEKLETLDDILGADAHYTRALANQLMLYLYLTAEEGGILLLKNRATGELRQIDVALNDQALQIVEGLLQKAAKLNAVIEKREQPEKLPYDKKLCGGCGYRVECWGDEEAFTPPPVEINEQELLDLLRERDQLAIAAKQYEKADARAKEIIKGSRIEKGQCGEFTWTLKESIFQVPAQPAQDRVTQRVTIKKS
jgi:hypothetical protein